MPTRSLCLRHGWWQVRRSISRCKQYRDVDTTAKGSERADGLERRIRKALQRSREALRLVLGKSRATIALI